MITTTWGEFDIDGIPPAPAGEAKFDVCFNIDANGILSVTAKDKSRKGSQLTVLEFLFF